jgi:hypothetical protein
MRRAACSTTAGPNTQRTVIPTGCAGSCFRTSMRLASRVRAEMRPNVMELPRGVRCLTPNSARLNRRRPNSAFWTSTNSYCTSALSTTLFQHSCSGSPQRRLNIRLSRDTRTGWLRARTPLSLRLQRSWSATRSTTGACLNRIRQRAGQWGRPYHLPTRPPALTRRKYQSETLPPLVILRPPPANPVQAACCQRRSPLKRSQRDAPGRLDRRSRRPLTLGRLPCGPLPQGSRRTGGSRTMPRRWMLACPRTPGESPRPTASSALMRMPVCCCSWVAILHRAGSGRGTVLVLLKGAAPVETSRRTTALSSRSTPQSAPLSCEALPPLRMLVTPRSTALHTPSAHSRTRTGPLRRRSTRTSPRSTPMTVSWARHPLCGAAVAPRRLSQLALAPVLGLPAGEALARSPLELRRQPRRVHHPVRRLSGSCRCRNA